jgi:hypothetical protein
VVALVAYGLIAVFGAVSGIRLVALERRLREQPDQPWNGLDARATAAVPLVAWMSRAGIALAVIFLMTVKPDALVSTIAVLVAAAAGAGLSLPAWNRARVRRQPS